MATNKPILLGWEKGIPSDIISDFSSVLNELSIPYLAEEREQRIYNASEFYIPTLVGIFIASNFFGGIFKEAGKDAYVALKNGIVRLAKNSSLLPVKIIKAGEYKVPDTSDYSRVFSIYSETVSGTKIKFIFPGKASDAEYFDMIDAMLKILEEHHQGVKNNFLAEMIPDRRSLQLLRYHKRSWELWKPL
ncbi:hypothetical protein [Pedosphaera parvula]|nr:hypothetical protein [Pedosphaera parvula]